MGTKLFSDPGLSSELLKAINRFGFEPAAPIQPEAMALLLEGHDVAVNRRPGRV